MIRQLDYIHLPSFFSGTQNLMNGLRSHMGQGIQSLSAYLRYNELTLGGSVITINLVSIAAAEIFMKGTLGSERVAFLQKPMIRFAVWTIGAAAGICACNYLLKLQLDHVHIVASVAIAILLKFSWQTLRHTPVSKTPIKEEVTEKQGPKIEPVEKKNSINPEDKAILDEGADAEHSHGLIEPQNEAGADKKTETSLPQVPASDKARDGISTDDSEALDDELEVGDDENAGEGMDSLDMTDAQIQSSGGMGSLLETGRLNQHYNGLVGF